MKRLKEMTISDLDWEIYKTLKNPDRSKLVYIFGAAVIAFSSFGIWLVCHFCQ